MANQALGALLGASTWRLLGRFRRDRRGGTAVQAIVTLPVIIVAFMGLVRVWQVVQIRDSLHNGTYQAMRFLSLYPPETTDPYAWQDAGKQFIVKNLDDNPWVDNLVTDANPEVVVTPPTEFTCGAKFTILATYRFFVLGSDQDPAGFPSLMQMEMKDEREGEVLCQ